MDKAKNIWIFSGEASGDLYGSRLARELFAMGGDDVRIAGMGAGEMKAAGVDIIVDSSEMGVIGFIEVLKHIRMFKRTFEFLLDKALKERPDVVVMIDYPGFNLRFAKKLHAAGIPVIWYISPQVWAWKKGRIPLLAEVVDKMMCIFPFEVDAYKDVDLDVEFIGHPLVQEVQKRADSSIERDDNTVVLLPGSRANEINSLFKPMLETACSIYKDKPELKFVVSAPRQKIVEIITDIYEAFRKENPECPEVEVCCGKTAYWMQKASQGIAASGTVTVECAIAGLPLVVIYKVNTLTYFLAKLLVKLPYFCMVNILGKKEVYPEFLQHAVTVENMSGALRPMLVGGEKREKTLEEMTGVVDSISGGAESVAHRAAEICWEFVNK